jgi:hypothetical protein
MFAAAEVLTSWSPPIFETLPAARSTASGATDMADKYAQPANWTARVVFLIGVALPVFGALYYALLNFLLFG